MPGFAAKSEIRSTKSETNPKSEIENVLAGWHLFWVSDFDIRICFGFRYSNFGFGCKALVPGAPDRYAFLTGKHGDAGVTEGVIVAQQRAVVLLSGGLDSATVLAIARAEGFVPFALSFDYGQRHAVELDAARQVAAALGAVRHLVMPIDLRTFGGSALTADLPVPKDRTPAAMSQGIPSTYVPARNTIFLALALAWCEVLGACDLFIGVNALDYAGYPDCRPEFLAAFEHLAELGTKAGAEGKRFHIHAPLVQLTKAEIIRRGLELGVDYALTTSCYDPAADGAACGRCDACVLRLEGFAANGVPDPGRYTR